eukprot:6185832-Prymnesium_polylepis.1
MRNAHASAVQNGRRDYQIRTKSTGRVCVTCLTWGRWARRAAAGPGASCPTSRVGSPETPDGSALQGGLGRDTPPAC